jgi:hypothetical protein
MTVLLAADGDFIPAPPHYQLTTRAFPLVDLIADRGRIFMQPDVPLKPIELMIHAVLTILEDQGRVNVARLIDAASRR